MDTRLDARTLPPCLSPSCGSHGHTPSEASHSPYRCLWYKHMVCLWSSVMPSVEQWKSQDWRKVLGASVNIATLNCHTQYFDHRKCYFKNGVWEKKSKRANLDNIQSLLLSSHGPTVGSYVPWICKGLLNNLAGVGEIDETLTVLRNPSMTHNYDQPLEHYCIQTCYCASFLAQYPSGQNFFWKANRQTRHTQYNFCLLTALLGGVWLTHPLCI